MKKLTKENKDFILNLIKKVNNDLALIVQDTDFTNLSYENKIEIANILTDEFCATGINDDYEPNDRGLRVEELIDIVLKL